jgi:hypothetical protein
VTSRTGQTEQERQNGTYRTGQAETDRQTGHAELDRQNWTGKTRKMKSVIGRIGQADLTRRTGQAKRDRRKRKIVIAEQDK